METKVKEEDKVKIYYVSERDSNDIKDIELINNNADIYYKDSNDKFILLLLYRKNEIPNKYIKNLSEIKSTKNIKLQNGKSLTIEKPCQFNIKTEKYFNILKPIINIVNDYLIYTYKIINNVDYEIITTFYLNKNSKSLHLPKLEKVSNLEKCKSLHFSNYNIIINVNNQDIIYKQYGFKINISNNDLLIYNTNICTNVSKSLILLTKAKPKISINLIN
jgi:hypothetical protein